MPPYGTVASGRKPMTPRQEMTVDGGVNRQESLGLLERLESAHSPLAFSRGLMRVLRPFVQPVSTFMSDSGQHTRKRGRVAAEAIRNHGMRNGIRPLQ